VHPEFELKDYSGYEFKRAVYTIDDEAVQKEINMILKGHGTMLTVEEAAQAADTVIGPRTTPSVKRLKARKPA